MRVKTLLVGLSVVVALSSASCQRAEAGDKSTYSNKELTGLLVAAVTFIDAGNCPGLSVDLDLAGDLADQRYGERNGWASDKEVKQYAVKSLTTLKEFPRTSCARIRANATGLGIKAD